MSARAEERAELIIRTVSGYGFADSHKPNGIDFVVNQIDQACAEREEAYARRWMVDFIDGLKGQLIREEIYQRGFKAGAETMRERAAKVCRTSLDYEWAANQIETLQPSPEREGV